MNPEAAEYAKLVIIATVIIALGGMLLEAIRAWWKR